MIRHLRAWLARVAGFLAPDRGEREFADELQSHIELQTDDHIRAGISPAEARRRALARMGSVAAVAEAHRDRRGLPHLESLLQDARYAVRGLRRSPGFAAACAATLALGIGINSAIFSVVNGVLFAPLPYARPDQLVTIWSSHPEIRGQSAAMSRDNAMDLRASMTTIQSLEVLQANLTETMPIDGEGTIVNGAQVTPALFDLLGTPPLYGRGLRPGDDTTVIVISHGFWQRQFGGDPAVVGRRLGSGAASATVVGVMPSGFALPYPSMLQASVSFVSAAEVAFWMPLLDPKPGSTDRSARRFAVLARLKEHTSVDAARADLARAWQQLVQAYPEVNRGWQAYLVPLHQQAVAPVRGSLLLLFASVGLVLLIACVNVANLVLARGVARQRELALRAALGANRSRLMQQVVIEGLVLSSIGAALGLILARWATPAIVRFAPAGTPRLDEIGTNWTVVLFTMGVALACGIAVSVLPAFGASRVSVRSALAEGGRSASDPRRRLRGGLVAAEIALAVALAIGAGLLARSFVAVLNTDPGFEADHLLTLGINVPRRHNTDETRIAFYQQLFQRLEAIPGVAAVGGTTRLPLGGTNSITQVAVEGRIPDGPWPEADFRRAVHAYFETMRIPILRGRGFTDADRAGAPPVVVINETLARRLFADEDPLGRQIRLGPSSPVRQGTVVGIVGDLRHQKLDIAPAPEVYINYLQGPPVAPLLAIRTSGDPSALGLSIRAALREVDETMVPSNVRTMDDLKAASVRERVFLVALVLGFGALALVLAAVGVYGVLSLLVAERTREIGIRLALGASPAGLVALILTHAVTLTVLGISAGVAAALALAPLLASQLYGVAPTDPATLATVTVVLLAIAICAALVPAARVLRVDPVRILRCD
ncbi:MAG TPA: ABC transporter permease [Vicinamibacterales bacterium]|nr:ABC transporter permease [Vicinamibacterales bacterium]